MIVRGDIMTSKQFDKLKVGDFCTLNKGFDAGRRCKVVYKDKISAVIQLDDGDPDEHFSGYSQYGYGYLKLATRNTLDVYVGFVKRK